MSNKDNKTQQNKKALLKALQKNMGIVTKACEMVDLNRWTFYDYYKKDKQFAEDVDSMQDYVLDFAESKLFENIEEKKEASIFFYLKCKGKKRGYIERQEVVNNQAESSEFNYDAMPIELLKKLNEFRKS